MLEKNISKIIVLMIIVLAGGTGAAVYNSLSADASEKEKLNMKYQEAQTEIEDLQEKIIQNHAEKKNISDEKNEQNAATADNAKTETKESAERTVEKSTNESDWKTYKNDRYQYTVKYPKNWHVDTTYSEDDFTQRGPVEDKTFIGGDTIWSNYQNPREFNLGNVPQDLQQVDLMIYKSTPTETLEAFIQKQNMMFDKKETLNINSFNGIKIISEDKETGIVSTHILIKIQDKIFKFDSKEKANEILLKMLDTFQLK